MRRAPWQQGAHFVSEPRMPLEKALEAFRLRTIIVLRVPSRLAHGKIGDTRNFQDLSQEDALLSVLALSRSLKCALIAADVLGEDVESQE